MVLPSFPDSLDTSALRKARGAFFTPEPVAKFVTSWAVRGASERVLEPSCGEASFLLPAANRMAALAAASPVGADQGVLDGVELHAESAAAARALMAEAGAPARVQVADFFTVTPTGSYDAVIGNPPYVRYQDFSGQDRSRSRAAALRAGVSLTGLASSWAAFTVHAALFLKPGGRLGLVLPAELLSVNYAAEVRRFLLERFASVDLVLFSERVFPGVLEEVVLLMADGYQQGPTEHANVFQVQSAADLTAIPPSRAWRPRRAQDKWTPSLLPTEALAAYSDALDDPRFTTLHTWADTTLGMVTGNNKYFALSPARVRELGLHPSDVAQLSPPGSRHLRALELTADRLAQLGDEGASTWLFRPASEPSSQAWDYIEAGDISGVPLAYKCRVRTPWWRVPLLRPADVLLTYMNADTPRLTTNHSGAHHLNSVHGLYLRPQLQLIGRELLPLASLTSITLLGAEIVGRAYGGGMLKLEPGEADVLPVPSIDLVRSAAADLAAVRTTVAELLGRGRLADAVGIVDEIVLTCHLGMSGAQLSAVRAAHAALTTRRTARGVDARRRR